ncbi:hypothetical protein [Cellulomonas iranensis]|nr:hypothetical protein [Cellulomonas iranensis]
MSETDDGSTIHPDQLSEEGVGGTVDGVPSTFEPEEDPDLTAGA